MDKRHDTIEQTKEMILVKIKAELWPGTIPFGEPLDKLIGVLARYIAESQYEIDELREEIQKLKRLTSRFENN